MFIIKPEISKKFIEERISEEDMWERYFQVNFRVIFKSPLRVDKSSTCSMFKHKNGQWWMKDHNGSFCGSVWDALMYSRNISFSDVLELVAKDYGLLNISYNNVITPIKRNIITEPVQKRVIQIKVREWEDYDYNYWFSYGWTQEQIDTFPVFPTSIVWLSNKYNGELEIKVISNPLSPVYAYRLANFEYKIYMPLNKDFRFICNTSRWNGWEQLPSKGELVIITKSMKDIGLLHRLGYASCGSQGEGHSLPEDNIIELKRRFKVVVLLFDNDYNKEDNVGRRNAIKNSEKFGIPWMEIPTDYQIKDASDFFKEHGIKKTEELIKSLIKDLI